MATANCISERIYPTRLVSLSFAFFSLVRALSVSLALYLAFCLSTIIEQQEKKADTCHLKD